MVGSCDVIVVGVGGMGSAACAHLADLAVDGDTDLPVDGFAMDRDAIEAATDD